MTDKRLKFIETSVVLEQMEAFVEPITPQVKLRLSRLLSTTMRDSNLHITVNFNTVELALDAQSTLPLPDDVVTPYKVFLKKNCGGKAILYQFGRREKVTNYSFLDCTLPDEDTIADTCSSVQLPSVINQNWNPYYNYNIHYAENYGKKNTRFFGFWEYNTIENRVEVTNGSLGDRFIVVYEVQNSSYNTIPEYAVNAIIYRTLQNYYMASNPQTARSFEIRFKQELPMIASYVERGYSYQDYLDGITSEYTNTIQ
jgi:hypothetical protein